MNYDGLFFNEKNTNKLLSMDYNKLKIVKRPLHVTLSASNSRKDLYGKKYNIKVVAYGSDGQNSGFQVELPIELQDLTKNIPHITTSIAECTSSKNTKNLEFKKLDYPFFIEATFSNSQIQEQQYTKKKKIKLNYKNFIFFYFYVRIYSDKENLPSSNIKIRRLCVCIKLMII